MLAGVFRLVVIINDAAVVVFWCALDVVVDYHFSSCLPICKL